MVTWWHMAWNGFQFLFLPFFSNVVTRFVLIWRICHVTRSCIKKIFALMLLFSCIGILLHYCFLGQVLFFLCKSGQANCVNGILLPKLFWPTVRKNYSSDRENLLKFEAEGQEVSKFLRSLEQFIQTVKGRNNVW